MRGLRVKELDLPPERRRGLLRTAAVVVVLDVIIALVMAGGRPARPSLGMVTLPPTTATTTPAPADGLLVLLAPRTGAVQGGAQATARCFLGAETPASRAVGLRGRRSFGRAAGLALVHPAPTTTGVTLAGVTLTVDVAYFDGLGRFVSLVAARPCPTATACPVYPPARPYRLALEVPPASVAGLRLGPGATALVGGPCST